MSQLTDEQIQQLLEAGKSLPDRSSAKQFTEARRYQQLFAELKKELPVQPDADFSVRVMNRIEGLQPAVTKSVSYGWLWVGLSICLLITALALAPMDGVMTDLMSVLAMLNPIKWALAFGLLSLLIVQLLDFKLIRGPSLPKLT
ncbi:hypothetical protein [Spirosoma foliorum]|uniref:DUF5056 domain-containing protein n=1 Tax=Spirosoma foliorum TaxID=2710596 RepID=A0A7G5H0B1_9BACT|nr:hypothetical protein [Spirosoma foliorum]QMW04553.1 hypothetical protein H3H32_06330 [Spirosoma foliorum]